MVPIEELYEVGCDLEVTVDTRTLPESGAALTGEARATARRGTTTRPAVPAFMTAGDADVYRVTTEDGYEIKATEWHDFYTQRGKIKLRDLKPGDELLVQSGKGQFGRQGSEDLGLLLGLVAGDGHFTNRGRGKEAAIISLWGEEMQLADRVQRLRQHADRGCVAARAPSAHGRARSPCPNATWCSSVSGHCSRGCSSTTASRARRS